MPIYVVNPRGSVRQLDESVAKKMLQTPGWVEITNPQEQKETYLPQYDHGPTFQTSLTAFTNDYKEQSMSVFATKVV
jgi:hypothetical protein